MKNKLPGAYGRSYGSRGKMQSQDGICDTLQAAMGNGGGNVPIVEVKRQPLKFLTRNQKNIEGDYAYCIDTAHTGGIMEKYENGNLRIRKLTPKECWRLQGFDDEDFAKAEAVNSNTQLYKQAGNSIVVPVLEYIIQVLADCGVWESGELNV